MGRSLASIASRPTQTEEQLALVGASLQRATVEDMTASNEGGIPFKMDVVGQRSLRYSDGNSNYLSEKDLGNSTSVWNFTNGYLTQDTDTGDQTFTAADMSSLGATLSAEDYGYASKRLYNLNANYDAAGWWHDTKATIGGWFGLAPNPVRTPDMEQERWELRQITAGYAGSHPQVWAPTFAGVDAAAGGPTGAVAVVATSNRSYQDRQFAYRLANAADQGIQAFGSVQAAKQGVQALQFLGTQKVEPGGRLITVRDGRAGPASDAIEFQNLKDSYRARDAGMPDIRQPARMYGLSMKEIVARFESDGYSTRNSQTRTKSVSEVFSIENHPDIASIQRTENGSAHNGLYYKYKLHNGNELKVIDPLEYGNPKGAKPGKFFAPNGQEIYWDNGWQSVR